MDFSKYNTVKFIVSYYSTSKYRVIEETLPCSYIINKDIGIKDFLIASPASTWFYAYVTLTDGTVKIGRAMNDNVDVTSGTKLYIYVQ